MQLNKMIQFTSNVSTRQHFIENLINDCMAPDLISIQYKDIINEATDLVHIVSPEGKILFANDSWRRGLQYSLDELIGQSIYRFVHHDRVAEFQAFRNALIADKIIHCPIETTLVRRDDEPLFVEGFMSCHLADNEVVYTHSILRDVTVKRAQIKQIEETLYASGKENKILTS